MAIGLGAALLGSALIGGASSAIGGSKASKAAQQAADANNALQRDIYSSNSANLSPYMERGGAAGTQINALLGLGGDPDAAQRAFQDYANSTGYQFQLKSGSDAIGTNKAASGLLRSGSTLKALTKYGSDLGSTYFGNYLNALQGQQQTGLSGANALAGVGTNYANAVSGNNDSAASAKANSAINTSNQVNQLLGTGLNAYAYNGGLGSSYGKSSLPRGYQSI